MWSSDDWTKYVIPVALALMVLVLLYAGVAFVTTMRQTRATMETLSARMERELTPVGALEAKSEAIAGRLATVDASIADVERSAAATREALDSSIGALDVRVTAGSAQAETAAARAAEAVAAAQTAVAEARATPSPTSTPAGPAVPLDGGVSLTYRAGGETEAIFYSVDQFRVYLDYGQFEQTWPPEGPAVLQFALIKSGQDASGWTLYYSRAIAETEFQPIQWNEYAVLAAFDALGAAGAADVRLDQGEPFPIDDWDSFEVEPDARTFDSLLALQDTGANVDGAVRLLLADHSAGKVAYTLILFDREAGGGSDWYYRWCGGCWEDYCSWFCR